MPAWRPAATNATGGPNVTVLSGDLGGDDPADAHGVVLDWSDIVTGTNNVYYVVKADSVSNVVLDGFYVTGGHNDIGGWNVGAALFPTYSNLTLRNLVFQGNRSFGTGGAVYFYEGTHTLTDIDFIGNAGSSAGGVYFRSPGGATLTLGLCYTADEIGSLAEADLRAYRWNGTEWEGPLRSAPVNRCVMVSGVTSFSEWILAIPPVVPRR